MKKMPMIPLLLLALCFVGASAQEALPAAPTPTPTAAPTAAPTAVPKFSIPEIVVPEMPEIDVPEVPKAKETRTPKIEVPRIPEIALPDAILPNEAAEGPEASAAPALAEDPEAEAALAALGDADFRSAYEALKAGAAIEQGTRGAAAAGLQKLLNAFGHTLSVDGIVGPKTLAALAEVQNRLGLEQTGRVTAVEYARLLRALVLSEQTQPEENH
ncbi:MAG: peptidoglycan-binding protein [Clostridia bacterium]|nr:peptidoglycan-binding protein [Clostridia bacterium]